MPQQPPSATGLGGTTSRNRSYLLPVFGKTTQTKQRRVRSNGSERTTATRMVLEQQEPAAEQHHSMTMPAATNNNNNITQANHNSARPAVPPSISITTKTGNSSSSSSKTNKNDSTTTTTATATTSTLKAPPPAAPPRISTTDDADVAAGDRATAAAAAVHHHHPQHNRDYNSHLYYHPQPQQQLQLLQQEPHTKSANNTNATTATGSSNVSLSSVETAPASVCTINTGNAGDLEFFEDLITEPVLKTLPEPVLVLGVDISHHSRATQFAVCAVGLFFFSLLYGYLQELLSVELCSRQLGLFLAMMQFSGYTVLAYILRNFVYSKQQKHYQLSKHHHHHLHHHKSSSRTLSVKDGSSAAAAGVGGVVQVPLALYLGLSLLRAVDLAMTNLAMQYINYPAKTLMKSSRVVFTMIFGVLIQRKQYKTVDYAIVLAMVVGLAMFMHADAHSSAVFHHMGVIMLTVSLVCDGAISNMSETIMSQFGVGQDEFIFRLYSISLIAITAAAAFKGDLYAGLIWMSQPGTYQQYINGTPLEERSWSVTSKILVMILFSSMGFFGSSCSAAITKQFGALTMSITSTARKATTLFLSFFLFNNVCTLEHIAGVVVFITALTTKSMRRRHHHGSHSHGSHHRHRHDKSHGKKTDRRRQRRFRGKNGGAASYSEVPMAEIPASPSKKSELRHRINSHEDMEQLLHGGGASATATTTTTNGNTTSRSMVHVV